MTKFLWSELTTGSTMGSSGRTGVRWASTGTGGRSWTVFFIFDCSLSNNPVDKTVRWSLQWQWTTAFIGFRWLLFFYGFQISGFCFDYSKRDKKSDNQICIEPKWRHFCLWHIANIIRFTGCCLPQKIITLICKTIKCLCILSAAEFTLEFTSDIFKPDL